jgi:hypothetical protein
MQILYGMNTAANILFTAQKRLIRPAYAQTQGFPYAAYLDLSLRNTDNSIRLPLSTDTSAGVAAGQGTVPLARTASAYTYEGSLIPGLVMVKTNSENACVASGASAAIQPWGLLGQWVGGTFDNVGQNNEIGLWMGPDSVYELLAPAWNDTTVAAQFAATTAGVPVLLYAGTDGRLTYLASPGSQVAVARVIDRPSASRLLIQMLI